jgi:hypothetical protein
MPLTRLSIDWDRLPESEDPLPPVSLGYWGLVNLKTGTPGGGGFGGAVRLSGSAVVKAKEEVLLNMDPLGDGAKSEGLERKVWLVCWKREGRLRSRLVSCPESWPEGDDAGFGLGAIVEM